MNLQIIDNKQIVNISDLSNWEKNPREIKKEKFEKLKKKIKRWGQFKPILVNDEGVVIGGNMRLRAYRELGIDNIWVSVKNPKDENDMMELSLADNEEAGYYSTDLLANIMHDYDIQWEDYAVNIRDQESLKRLADMAKGTDEDEVPEIDNTPAISKYGEVYQLGRHRLMCGDATKIEDIEKLMGGQKADMVFTDPPYGIGVVKDGKVGADFGVAQKGQYSPVINDETTQTAQDAYNLFVALGINKIILWGGNYFLSFLPASDGWLIWDKRGDSGIENTFADGEMAWCNFHTPVRIYTQLWNGMIREGEHEKRVHPTQKPIRTLSKIIKDFSQDNQMVLDTFGGSGSTLIACEQTNRTCYMMELDPKYCDVIRKRYDNFISKNTNNS